MKTVSSKLLSCVSFMLVFAFLFAALPALKVDAIAYSGSSSYASGKYYSALKAVNATGNHRVDIANIGLSQVGYQESSSSSQLSGESYGNGNYTEYGRWYNMQDMWCAIFVSWCAAVAGVSESVIPKHAYTPSGLSFFQNRGQAYSRATVAAGGYTPIKGDIVYFKSPRNNNPTNHVGIVTGYSGTTLYTVEGNTSSATVSTDGGAVASKSYDISNTYIVYICKPAYATGSNVTTSSYINTLEVSASESVTNTNNSVSASISMTKGENFSLKGWSVHSEGVDHYEWNINSTSWGTLSGGYRSDVANATPSYKNCTTLNSFNIPLSSSNFSVGANTIDVRGYTKSGNYYTIGRLNFYVYPAADSTYIYVGKTSFPVDEGITVSMKGAHEKAWVGLFAKGDVPGNVTSYYYYEMGTKDVTINIPKESGVGYNSSRGELTPGEYVLYLFVDEGYTIDTSVNVTLTAAEGARSSIDRPNPKTFEISQGDSFYTAAWALHNKGIASFYYTVDGGTKIGISNVGVRTDLFTTFPAYSTSCADLNYFTTYISTTDWALGTHSVKLYALSKSGYEISMGTLTVTVVAPPERLTAAASSSVVISREGSVATAKNISAMLTANDITAMFNESCAILDANGNKVTSGYVGTGCKVVHYSSSGDIDDELLIIVTADVNGDGYANGKDIIKMRKAVENGVDVGYAEAADVNGDGVLDAEDISAVMGLV